MAERKHRKVEDVNNRKECREKHRELRAKQGIDETLEDKQTVGRKQNFYV